MNDGEKERIDELAKAFNIDSDIIAGIRFITGYWVVDDVNNILYTAENKQFTEEVLLLDLLTLLYVPVGEKYTIFLGKNKYFLAVDNDLCRDIDRM